MKFKFPAAAPKLQFLSRNWPVGSCRVAVGHALSGGYRGVLPVGFRISCRASACLALWKTVGFPENLRAVGRRTSNSVGRQKIVKPLSITIQKPLCRESRSVGQLMAGRGRNFVGDWPGLSGVGHRWVSRRKVFVGATFQTLSGIVSWQGFVVDSGLSGSVASRSSHAQPTDHFRISWYRMSYRRLKPLPATQDRAFNGYFDGYGDAMLIRWPFR